MNVLDFHFQITLHMNACSILVCVLSTLLNLGIQLKNKTTALQHYTCQ